MRLNFEWKTILVFVALTAIVFVNNGKISLWDQDEAAYAGFAKRMIETHNYIVPNFTWSEPHRKPPLHFWLIALSYKIFGVNTFALRFFVALALLGTYLMVYFFGKKFIGEQAALFSAIVLGTNFFAPLLGKVAVTDGLLLFFHTLAGFSLLNVLLWRKWKYVFWFYFAIALGLLVKGPPILIFTGFFVIILFIFHPKRKNLIILHPYLFGWFALLPLFIWGYLAWKQNPQFVKWLIDWYILRRIHGAVFGQTGPVGYYLVTIIIFFSPYFVFLPAAFKNMLKPFWQKPKNQWFLIGAWTISGWLFYEFLKSKLPAYVIAAYPGFAMAIGFQMYLSAKDKIDIKWLKYSSIFHGLIALALAAGLVYVGKKFLSTATYDQILGIVTLYLLLTFYGLVLIWLEKINKSYKVLVINAFTFLFLFLALILPKIDNLRNAPFKAASYIHNNASINSTIVVANHYGDPPSLPFYLEKFMPSSKIIYTENYQKIQQVFDTANNCVLILNPKLKEKFFSKYSGYYVKHIESIAIDRPGRLDYFIVIKRY